MEDGFFTGQPAWEAFASTVQSWIGEGEVIGELSLPE
jgi:hypothetical protein